MRVILAGGSGLIGRELAQVLLNAGYEVIVLSRNPDANASHSARISMVHWDGKTSDGWAELVEGAHAVVNLAGANIAGEGFFPSRWTDERKQRIYQSRVDAGKALVSALQAARIKPRLLVQSSAIGYYGVQGDVPLTESSPAGLDFMARVCVDWENSTQAAEALGIRRVIIRTGVVFTAKGGALTRMLLPYRLFAGGPYGNGRQVVSWIHIADEVNAILHLIENEEADGVYNLTAPGPVTNNELGRTLGKVMHRPHWLPIPGFAMRLLFGEVATVVLDGQKVLPERLLSSGYVFQYPHILEAIQNILVR